MSGRAASPWFRAPVTQSLYGHWKLRALDGPEVPESFQGRTWPARIHGSVHSALWASKAIPSPLEQPGEPGWFDDTAMAWIGRTGWEYSFEFHSSWIPDHLKQERIDLVCDGLDTLAEVFLNGTEVGRAENFFHPHRFDVRHALRLGTNAIVLRFGAPLSHIRAEEARLGARPVNGDWDPYIFLRKPAYSFGWDFAPKVPSCGIWNSVTLEGWSGLRVAAVRPIPRRDAGRDWVVRVSIDVEHADPSCVKDRIVMASLFDPAGRQCAAGWCRPGREGNPARVDLPVRDGEVWWPRGYGPSRDEQPLYRLDLECEGVRLWTGAVGLRELELRSNPGADSPFVIAVNGREVFCRGANVVPSGIIPCPWGKRWGDEKFAFEAAQHNMNMLRVWGGGMLPVDRFYDACDRLGILVWQDFMFACAMYPEEGPLPELVEREARHQISLLSRHPSVVIWCGGNECIWGHENWGWKERLKPGQSWGRNYYLELLPRLVRELDPSRPYWANSPWSGVEGVPPNDMSRGDQHIWDVWGEGYRTHVPAFCSEFGHQSPSDYRSLSFVLKPEDFQIDSPAMLHRQRATGGMETHIHSRIREWFSVPRDWDEWHFLSQLTQARALATGIEWMRSNRPRCMGSLVWQLNEVWPGMSWSILDKPAATSVREAFADRILTIQPHAGGLSLIAINDHDEPWRTSAWVRRCDLAGTVLAEARDVPIEVGSRSVHTVGDPADFVGRPSSPDREFILADAESLRASWYFVPDKELLYEAARFSLTIREDGDRLVAIAAVDSVIRDLTLQGRRAWIVGPEYHAAGCRTLLPGETWPLLRWSRADESLEAPTAESLAVRPMCWTANDFGRRGRLS